MILKLENRLEISCELKKAFCCGLKIAFTVFVTLCLLCFVCSAFRGWRNVCEKSWEIELNLSLTIYRSCAWSASNIIQLVQGTRQMHCCVWRMPWACRDRHHSIMCSDATWGMEPASGLCVLQCPQHTCRTDPEECWAGPTCWRNHLTGHGDCIIVCHCDCTVARGCGELDALGLFLVWSICKRTLCFSAFLNKIFGKKR